MSSLKILLHCNFENPNPSVGSVGNLFAPRTRIGSQPKASDTYEQLRHDFVGLCEIAINKTIVIVCRMN